MVRRRSRIAHPSATLAVLGVLLFGCHEEVAPRYETAAVKRAGVTAKVTASGTLSALVTVQVGSQVSGRVRELFVDFNSPVTRGQLIATLDPQLFAATVEQARANLLAAEGEHEKARVQSEEAARQLARTRSLHERSLISMAELESVQANADAARAQVQVMRGRVAQTQASLRQAQVNFDYTRVVSPIDGVVLSRNVDVGQTVAASLQAPTLFVLAEDLRKMQVDTSVAEADIGKLQAGREASFTVDAYPGERFHGTIRQLRNAAQTVQNVVTYNAVLDVENPDTKLKPGMTATVTFVYADRPEATCVANTALRFRPSTDAPTRATEPPDRARPWRSVWRKTESIIEQVYVLTGITDGLCTEITEGNLQPGDEVIVDVSGGDGTTGGGGRPGGGNPFRRH